MDRLEEIEDTIRDYEKRIAKLQKDRMEILVKQQGYEIGKQYKLTQKFRIAFPHVKSETASIKRFEVEADGEQMIVLDIPGVPYDISFSVEFKDLLEWQI